MARAFVAAGSNIAPARNLHRAIGLLAGRLRVRGISTVYCTVPEGRPGQPPFYNCVLEIETGSPPAELKAQLRAIEDDLGRVRTADRYAPRTIDLDLVLYDDLVLAGGGLVLPDPRIRERPFLAVPLAELAPDLVLPGSGQLVRDLADRMPRQGMRALPRYTATMRAEAGPASADNRRNGC